MTTEWRSSMPANRRWRAFIRVCVPVLLHEAQSLRVHVLGGREQIPPDARRGGQRRQRSAERLDHEPAIVAHLAQGAERLVPMNHAGAGNAAVRFADVDVDE